MKAQRDIFYSTTKQVTEDEYKRFGDYVMITTRNGTSIKFVMKFLKLMVTTS